jgi:hypothetical protein
MNRMQKTLPDRLFAGALHCAVLLCISAVASADDYRDARADLVTAYEAQDYPAMRVAALKSLDARPGFAGGLFNLALAEVLGGDADAALHALNVLLAKKIDFGADELDEFAPLHDLSGWDAYTSAVADLYKSVGNATVAYRHDVPDFIPEGIAIAPDGDLYLGSIRHGAIMKIGIKTGVEPQLIAAAADGPHWSVFGMRHDGVRTLWFVSAAIDEFASLDPDDAGKTGLYATDTKTGEFRVRAPLPASGDKQVLGDLILVDADTLFLADQTDGIVYCYRISTGEFSTVIERGALGSPQGLVLDESGDYLYVADYIGGLYRLRLATGEIKRVTALDSASDYGIDGLYRYGNKLIAIQNGIHPNRVVEFEFSADGAAVVASRILAMNLPEFDEPNLGVIRGDEFLFIANSHWNRFERDGSLPDDLSGPVVLSISLQSD